MTMVVITGEWTYILASISSAILAACCLAEYKSMMQWQAMFIKLSLEEVELRKLISDTKEQNDELRKILESYRN